VNYSCNILKLRVNRLSMEGQDISQLKHLNLCYKDELKSYGLEQHEVE